MLEAIFLGGTATTLALRLSVAVIIRSVEGPQEQNLDCHKVLSQPRVSGIGSEPELCSPVSHALFGKERMHEGLREAPLPSLASPV